MAKKEVGQIYYDWFNRQNLLDRLKITGIGVSFRNLINFIEGRIAQFSYKGLEPDLPPYILREALMFNNRLCFYKSKTFGIVLCRYLPLGTYDLYWRPEKVDLLALNGKTIATGVDFKDVVLVKDNKMDIIPFLWLSEYFEKMDNIENTLMKDIDILKLPAVFKGNEKMVSSFNTIIDKALNFKPFAVADKMGAESFEMFDINLPVSPEELLSLYKNYKNLALESLGISGTETQKRERLLVGEVESQSEYKNYKYEDFRDCQLTWIKEYNEKFDRKVELIETFVKFKEEHFELDADQAKLIAEAENTGGDNNHAKDVVDSD